MKKIIWKVGLTVLFTGTLLAQDPRPSITPEDGVVKIATDLILLDVTVTDASGKIVTGLMADDFEVFENGERQAITDLSFISRTVGSATGDGAPAHLTNDRLRVPLTPGQVRRTIAIVVDDLNLSFASVHSVRKALKTFVDSQMDVSDLVAIIRTSGGVGALRQFTSDKRMLHAAIEKIWWNPLGGSFDALASTSQNDTDISDRFTRESSLAASGSSKQSTIMLQSDSLTRRQAAEYDATKNASAQEEGAYAQSSLGAIKFVLDGMSRLPGRKAMMLFSDGLSISEGSNKTRASGVMDFLRDASSTANRSSVVVYTFDTKGQRSMSISAADNSYEIIDGHRGQKERERTQIFKESQDGLSYFADQTGGKALLNSDDLNGGIQRAMEEQAGYYLIGYIPDADAFDPHKRKFNKIEVKVRRPGLRVSYRSGFFTNDKVEAPRPMTAERQLAEVLASPFGQSDIGLNVNALYAHDPADGSYIRSFLHIDARNLVFSKTTEGWQTATFDVAALIAGENGVPVNTVDSKYTIKARGATYDAMLRNGFVYVVIMPVKNAGVYQYRVAVRDTSTGKIGSASQVVVIPDLKDKKLAISSLAVEDVSLATWQRMAQRKARPADAASTLLYDTVLREFHAGTILRYGYELYNAGTGRVHSPRIVTQARILQNDKSVFEGTPASLDMSRQSDLRQIKVSGAVTLAPTLSPGDYVLQIIVTDAASNRSATQIFPFEIIGN